MSAVAKSEDCVSPVRVTSTTADSKLSAMLKPTVKHPAQVARRNARERNRVRQVNQGFVTLRNHIPNGVKSKKLSKVETLRHAAAYIDFLRTVLTSTENQGNVQPFGFSAQESANTMDYFSSVSENSPNFHRASSVPQFHPAANLSENYANCSSPFYPGMNSGFYSHAPVDCNTEYLNQNYPNSLNYAPANSAKDNCNEKFFHKISPNTSDPSPSSSFLSEASYEQVQSPVEIKYSVNDMADYTHTAYC